MQAVMTYFNTLCPVQVITEIIFHSTQAGLQDLLGMTCIWYVFPWISEKTLCCLPLSYILWYYVFQMSGEWLAEK
jgi:hypothetical protein